MRLVVSGGRILDPASGTDRVGDLCVADGVVAGIGERPPGFSAEREIDARDRLVCPGLVDLAVRLREPGSERKATIASECAAAARGGVTSALCPPDTDPIVDTPAVVELIHQRAEEAGLARVEVLGALTHGLGGEQLAAQGALRAAGCVGVSNARRPVRDTEVMRRAMEYATTHDLTLHLQAEDPWLAEGRDVHEGAVSTTLGLPGIPAVAEAIAIARDLLLAEHTGARVHFGRLSAARSVALMAEARGRGLAVSADVAAHQLLLSDAALEGFDGAYHVRPPLRSATDRDALRAGLASGAIAAVCSDHQPHERDAKLEPFPLTEPGISGLETLVPLVLSLVRDDTLDLPGAIAALTSGPGAVLGTGAGTLAPGAAADLCVIDPQARWRPGADTLASRGHNTPWLGRELVGRVVLTVLGGEIVHEL